MNCSWDEINQQVSALFHREPKPAAIAQRPAFTNLYDPAPNDDDVYEVTTHYGADALVLEIEAEAVYLGQRPMPEELEWAANLSMDEFVDAYMQLA